MMISERIKEIREYFDNKQKELADILKVSRSTYANGIDPIPLLKLYEFCNYYGVSMDYICELSNIKKYNFINNKFTKENLGKKLREIRIENNDTQKDVANILGVD